MIGKLEKSSLLVRIATVGGRLLCDSRHRRIDILKRLDHVDVPVEEQVDFGRSAARNGTNLLNSGNAIDRLFDRPRDGHFHLLDRHYAVVHADDDARKIRGWKHGNRKAQRLKDADRRKNQDREGDRLRVTGKPVVGRVLVVLGHVELEDDFLPLFLVLLFLFFFWKLDLQLRLLQNIRFDLGKLKSSGADNAIAAFESFDHLNITRVMNSQRHGLLSLADHHRQPSSQKSRRTLR